MYKHKFIEVDTMPVGYDCEVDVIETQLIQLSPNMQRHIDNKLDGDLGFYLQKIIKSMYDGERVIFSYQEPDTKGI